MDTASIRATDIALCVLAPLALAILEIFHPHVHDFLSLDLPLWLTVHYAQMPLFALAGLAMAALVRARNDLAAIACRVTMFIFVVSYLPFDTAAGIVTGALAQSAHASASPEAWRPAIDAVWTHPIVGGSSTSSPPVLAALGAIAWSLGGIAAAISLRRAGASLWPCLLLALSGFGLTIFRTHAWPGGPFTFGLFSVAAAWILWGRWRTSSALQQ